MNACTNPTTTTEKISKDDQPTRALSRTLSPTSVVVWFLSVGTSLMGPGLTHRSILPCVRAVACRCDDV